jgi:hypothetical protein
MFVTQQIKILGVLAALFWLAATAVIRCFPACVTDPVWGSAQFVLTVPICWVCVDAVRRRARPAPEQLVPGTAIVVATEMLMDATALRWAHVIYGNTDLIDRLAAAWLLWGYAISLGCALVMARRKSLQLQGAAAQGGRAVAKLATFS